jgi:hypothetical protein
MFRPIAALFFFSQRRQNFSSHFSQSLGMFLEGGLQPGKGRVQIRIPGR